MSGAVLRAISAVALAFAWFGSLRSVAAGDAQELGVEAARAYVSKAAAAARERGAKPVDVLLIEARAQSALGQHSEAERLALQALRLDSRRADIEHFLGKLLIRQNRLKEAADHLRRVIEMGHGEGGWRLLGMAMEHSGDRAEAMRCYEKAASADPNDAEARLLLGNLLLQQDAFERALIELQRACDIDPQSAAARYALAQAQLRNGQAESAQKSLAIFRELKRAQNERPGVESATGAEHSARSVAAGFQVDMAKLFVQQGSAAASVAHLRDAVQIAPDDPAVREMLVSLHLQAGDAAAAREHLEKLVQIDAGNATHHVNLGTVLLQLKDRDGAARELKRAVALDSKQPEALNNLARLYLAAGENKSEALEHARALAALQPTAANYDLLAWALYANGDIEAARSASKKSTELDPASAVFQRRYQQLLKK